VSDTPNNPLAQLGLLRAGKVFAVLLLVALMIAGGWKGFKTAKLHLALARAHREFSGRQFMRAEFWTGRALDVDEKNIDATRLMAEINEAQDKPAGLGWRIKAAQRAPGNTADIMAWAKSAFRFGQGDMAVNALESLPPDFKKRSAGYHELMAGLALASHETGLAEAYFVKAAELDPANPVHQVNLAAFRLANSSNRDVRAAAARDLEAAMTDSRASLFAARALLADAIRNRDPARSQQFAEKLRSLPAHNLSDDLHCLEATVSQPAFRTALDEVEHRAESKAPWTTEAGDWLNSHGMGAETLRWVSHLPETIQSNVRVQITMAESYLAARDWSGLQTFLAGCHWEGGEFLRSAMLIRCQRELSQPWEKEWKDLVAEVEANPPEGFLLAQLVIGWKWRNEALGLLWGAATNPKSDSKALERLWEIYSQTNETRELLRVAKAQINLDPSSPAKKNNTAFLTLLLFGPSERSERLAREASTANPNVAEWAATYAFALHLAGKESEAKKVMESLPSEALSRPGIALYYAIVLAGNGDDTHARESLARLNPNGMLPEERKLAADLAQKLNAASH
jgi:Flp pilus assembly protein TadD